MLNIWQGTILGDDRLLRPGASVEVRDELTGLLVAIYSDKDGASPLDNPFNVGETAFIQFFAAAGYYKITATYSDGAAVLRYVQLGNASANDITDFIAELFTKEIADNAIEYLIPADLEESTKEDIRDNIDVYSKSEVISAIYPVGCFYTQYPDADSNTLSTAFPDSKRPADLFGGTWEAQWDDEGIDFHTERTSDTGLQTRTDGLQADQMQGHWHKYMANKDAADALSGTGYDFDRLNQNPVSTITNRVTGVITDGTNGDPRTGTVTCDKNRLVRIWKRTA